jgi:hypothetical protein
VTEKDNGNLDSSGLSPVFLSSPGFKNNDSNPCVYVYVCVCVCARASAFADGLKTKALLYYRAFVSRLFNKYINISEYLRMKGKNHLSHTNRFLC